MLTFDGQPLAEHYARVLAHHFGFQLLMGHAYEPPGAKELKQIRADAIYRPAVYGFPASVKAFSWRSRFDLFFSDEPLSGNAIFTCRMAGYPWPEDDLMAICQRVQDLPYGGQVSQAMIDQADWLDLHPEYRGLPRIADRHLAPAQIDVGKGPGEKPEGVWDWA